MRVLVVEDEPRLLASLGRALREEGYAVDIASDGHEGLTKAARNDYDGIVLDMLLPKVSGFEVLEQLRCKKRTPVLVMTALSSSGDKVKGLELGADDYITKPFDRVELIARLRALIRRSKGHTRSLITVGEITIDTRSRLVSKGGECIVLTPREFSILHYLAAMRGSVVPRAQLLSHISSETEETNSNLLDVHICTIRRKLGANIIETRRGDGFFVPGPPVDANVGHLDGKAGREVKETAAHAELTKNSWQSSDAA